MAELIPYDHPILSSPRTYNEIEDKKEFAKMLQDTCRLMHGIGLSCNQIGIDNRVFCIVVENYAETFFNPQITKYSDDKTMFVEGCLSQPDVFVNLSRPKEIRVEYTNSDGERITKDFGGITARIIQHEYDHMEGTNFLQRASKLKRDLALKKAKKIRK